MLKCHRIKKIYNKGKKNELVALNEFTFELPDKGLVALFGHSGCGKTTLLNMIGGLDSFNEGQITIDGDEIAKYNANKWDDIRNKKIGYIFQSYNLMENKTVYENIKTTLMLAGLSDLEVINGRIDSVLRIVKLSNFKNRKASSLSGGQRQRIAIARALAKYPKIIIADEPTGNLDEKNTIIIMNYLKEISKDVLVLLVSHEQRLVNHYADRIINIVDGKITGDHLNKSSGLTSKNDENIYLGDLSKEEIIAGCLNIDYYYDEKIPFKLTVLNVEGRIHLKMDTKAPYDIIDEKSDYVFIEGKPQENNNLNLLDENLLRTLTPMNNFGKGHLESTRGSFVNGVKNVFTKKKKIEIVSNLLYLCCAILFCFITCMFVGTFMVDESFYTRNHEEQYAASFKLTQEMYLELEDNGIEYISKYSTYSLENRNSENKANIDISTLTPLSAYNQEAVICGKMPSKPNGVLISTALAKKVLSNYAKTFMIDSPDDIIGMKITGVNACDLVITGICEYPYDVVYANSDYLLQTRNMAGDHYMMTVSYAKELGIIPNTLSVERNQVLTSIYNDKETTAFGLETRYFPYDSKTILGEDFYILNDITYKEFYYQDISSSSSVINFIYVNDYEKANSYFSKQSIQLTKYKDMLYENYMEDVMIQRLTYGGGCLGIMVIIIIVLLMVNKSIILSQIKEIGIKRAIGARKIMICKDYLLQSLGIFCVTLLPGILLSCLIIGKISAFSSFLYFNFWVFLIILTILLGAFLLLAYFPLRKLLKLTPSQILSKYDI